MFVQPGHNTYEMLHAVTHIPSCVCWIEEDGNGRPHRYDLDISRVSHILFLGHFSMRVCAQSPALIPLITLSENPLSTGRYL